MSTLHDSLNTANPTSLPSGAQVAKLGDALAITPAFARGATSSGNTLLVLPTNAKAIRILSAFAIAGGVTGYLVPDEGEAAPATGHCSVSPSGDILLRGADAITSIEVTYMPCEGAIVTETINVAASVGTLLSGKAARKLLSATVVTGVIAGAVGTIDARSAAAPAAGHCSLSLNGLTVNFNAAQVVNGTVSVTYIATPGIGAADPSLASRLASTVSF